MHKVVSCLLAVTLLVPLVGCAAAAVDVAAIPNVQGPILDSTGKSDLATAGGVAAAAYLAYQAAGLTSESAIEYETTAPTFEVDGVTIGALAVPFVIPGIGEVTHGDWNHIQDRHSLEGLAACMLLTLPETRCKLCDDGRLKCWNPADPRWAFGVFGVIVEGTSKLLYAITMFMAAPDYVDREMTIGHCKDGPFVGAN